VTILEQEVRGEITPINEYMRHTLKAFVQHVDATVATSQPVGDDIGEIVDEVTVGMEDGRSVRVVRRSSQQIQVFVDGEKVVARPMLRDLINAFELRVPPEALESSSRMNTRSIGALSSTRSNGGAPRGSCSDYASGYHGGNTSLRQLFLEKGSDGFADFHYSIHETADMDLSAEVEFELTLELPVDALLADLPGLFRDKFSVSILIEPPFSMPVRIPVLTPGD
jgi:hypothetical protein